MQEMFGICLVIKIGYTAAYAVKYLNINKEPDLS